MARSLTPLINTSFIVIWTINIRLICNGTRIFLLDLALLYHSIILISWRIQRLLGCTSRISLADIFIVGITGIKFVLNSIRLRREQMYLFHLVFSFHLHCHLLSRFILLGVLIYRVIWLIEGKIKFWTFTFDIFGFISHFINFDFF